MPGNRLGLLKNKVIAMDNIAIGTCEPSIGQVEYLKYLQAMSAVQKPSFSLVELTLPVCDNTVIERTVAFFLGRHDSLRTVFPVIDHEIRQLVLPVTDKRFRVEYVNVESDGPDFSDTRKACFEKASATFADIEQGPLVKLILFRGRETCFFSLLIHHVICDEWSCSLIRNELTVVYTAYAAGREPVLPPLKVRLRDYCERQNEWLRRNRDAISLFWKQRLAGFDAIFDMSGFQRMVRRSGNTIGSGLTKRHPFTSAELGAILDRPDASSYTCVLPSSLFLKMKDMSTEQNISFSSLVYACLFLFQYAYTGKKKLLVPALITDRLIPEHQLLIGCLLGSIYLPVKINEQMVINDFVAVMEKEIAVVSRYIIFSHRFLQLDGDRIRNCCDMYINYLDKQQDLPENPELGHRTEDYAIHYPIYCTITRYNDGLIFVWKYNRFLFGSNMITDMISFFETLIEYVMANGNEPVRDLNRLTRIPGLIS
jgi:hypothetical protein